MISNTIIDVFANTIFSLSLSISVIFKSVVSEAIAHKLLSTVDSKPDMSININGTITHAGNIACISSKLTVPLSAGMNPVPAAINPSIPIDSGTTANITAPSKKDFPILSFLIEKALCQKH